MSGRAIGFALFVLVAAGAAGLYIATRDKTSTNGATDPAPKTAAATAALDDIRSGPHVYFSSMKGDEFGQVVVASVDAPNERRFVTDLKCDRLDFAVARGVCLLDNRAAVMPPGIAKIVDRNFQTIATLDLPGFPSRTRVSPDERYGATTVFVLGENYNGNFATRTYIIDLQSGVMLGDLERFTTTKDGKTFSAVDFNFWGVTFTKDSNRFYATLRTGSSTYLVEGNVKEQTIRTLRTNVECPSLSPDERHIAFKSRQPNGTEWRLHVLDTQSMSEWPLEAETRSVDDQLEWFDNDHVLYHYTEERGLPEVAVNVWMSGITPDRSATRLFIRGGLSPAIVRTSAPPR